MAFKPKSILWPTDFSPRSIKGAQCARALCEAFDARLHVIHVAPILVWSSPGIPMATGGDLLVSTTDVITPAKKGLRDVIAKEFPGFKKITTDVRIGNAWSEICLYAKQNRIDIIVVATHGLTGLKRMFLGSTAELVVRHAPCPVLTVKSFAAVFTGGHKQPKAKSTRGKSRSTR